MDKHCRILSLDGGGLKGLFTAKLLADLETNLSLQVAEHFDLITGTSTGAIIAIGLGMGIRVCTLAWWPGKIAPGSSTDAITAHMDWLPTFTALADARLPHKKLDGIDLSPLLLGRTSGFHPREVFYYYRGFDLEAVRSGPWKLHLAKGQLYRLDADIGEARDIATDHPQEAARLRELAQAMDADLGLSGTDAPGIRPLGRVAHPKPIPTP